MGKNELLSVIDQLSEFQIGQLSKMPVKFNGSLNNRVGLED